MRNGSSYFKWPVFCFAAVLLLTFSFNLHASDTVSASAVKKMRADLIFIDTLSAHGKLERPEVIFPHDLHTERMKKVEKDCSACHKTQEDKLVPKFMRVEDPGKEALAEMYHNGCISCHEEMNIQAEMITGSDGKKKKEYAAPVECAGCHVKNPSVASSRVLMEFDRSIHARHEMAFEGKCDACHHNYDEKLEKTVYVKGEESSCRYCHKENKADLKAPVKADLQEASHASCIGCHTERIKAEKTAGPVTCYGCHDSTKIQSITKLDPIPRMKRNQPDVALIRTDKKELKNKMGYVPFDHLAHENYNQTCRACHHESLKKCSDCHTLNGKTEGQGITLTNAMHDAKNESSCIGCHNSYKRDKNCAGCHSLMGSEKAQNNQNCVSCHMDSNNMEMEDAELAKDLISKRNNSLLIYSEEQIPETVVIDRLAAEYQKVEFPHRKVVNGIVSRIKDNKIAGTFHMDKGTLCQGCHHNAPVTDKPAGCANCHEVKKTASLDRPSLVGAYHGQCMGCHEDMQIKLEEISGNCTECHEKR